MNVTLPGSAAPGLNLERLPSLVGVPNLAKLPIIPVRRHFVVQVCLLSQECFRKLVRMFQEAESAFPGFGRRNANLRNGELVGGGVSDVVDDEGFGDAFGGLELEAELFPEDGEERWVGGVGSFVGSPFDLEVEVAF